LRRQGGPHLQHAGWGLVRAKRACLATSREGVRPPGFSVLDPWQIRRRLSTPGWRIVCLDAIGSTNDVAAAAGRRGLGGRLAVFAERQTRGRGRRGRPWHAPPGRALLVSTLWRPTAAAVPGMVQVSAVAALAAMGRFGVEARVKWPNDLLLDRAKVGGILIEAAFIGERLEFMVAGIGLNVLQRAEELPPTAYPATSVHLATGRRLDRAELAAALLDELAAAGRLWLLDPAAVFARWRAALETVGRRVAVDGPDGRLVGRALDVEPDGALLLERDDGRVERLFSGELSARDP
jgi:BirA family biotin operon repressor/biotin-[acetyl-CoA-carboxylase] ligase